MAGASLLTLLDDIATILDDVAVMSKVAAKKTAGVLGDDLALNAQQVAGVSAERELPVVWAVAKGSMRNKVILVPAALAISALAPALVTPLLMVGGAYLCYEGFEKLAHKVLHSAGEDAQHHAEHLDAIVHPEVDMVKFEQDKIRGAVRTDFILSAEIIVISLGTVALAPFAKQVGVLSVIAVVMTVGVYGFVAGIVKLDDAGLHLAGREGPGFGAGVQRRLGAVLLAAAPWLMKALSVAGTAAMFLVGGGILVHGIVPLDTLVHSIALAAHEFPVAGQVLEVLASMLLNGIAGIVAGGLVLAGVEGAQRLRKVPRPG